MNKNNPVTSLVNLVKSGYPIGIERFKNRQNRMPISPDQLELNTGRPIALDRGNLAANRASGVLITAGSVLDRRIEAGIRRCRLMVIRVKLATEKNADRPILTAINRSRPIAQSLFPWTA